MPQFQPDIATFGDLAGYGMFDVGHYREHIQFVQVLAAMTPPVILANYDLASLLTAGSARKAQIEAHSDAHQELRQLAGITGIDLTEVDFDKQDDFYVWLGAHATEHSQIRQFLGII